MKRTRVEHTYRDLVYVGVSGADGEVITYGAASASTPGKTNLVSYDVQTGEVECTCRWCETHPHDEPACWLARSVVAAWERHPACQEVAQLGDTALLAYGSKLASFVRQYRERTGRALPADLTNLLAARTEYRRRAAARELTKEGAA